MIMARIGEVIDDKYEILKQIGKGGMSTVYLATDKRLNKQWAVKEIRRVDNSRNTQIEIESSIAEANLIKRFDHPMLPRIVDIIQLDNVVYVVMDYIEGEPLSKILGKNGPQLQENVIEWAKDLCDVLDYLHTREPAIIYRDMKPANIMLKPDGNIKLIDFGIAREYKEHNLEDTVSLGTKGYAAPEQFGGKGQTDARTDIYCLGVTLYHLVTGKNPCEPPYELYPIRYWNPSLSGGLEYIIQKCIQMNPADRYQSCFEVKYALEHYNEVDTEFRKKCKRHVIGFFAVVALFLLSLSVGFIGIVQADNVKNETYEAQIVLAEKESSPTKKEELYFDAIKILPGKIAAYEGLMELYKNDASFTLDEEEKLKSVLTLNMENLRKDNEYGKLAFDVGKLYWYYYMGTESKIDMNNQALCMVMATQWFEDAVNYTDESFEHYNMARIYRDIGIFNRDINLQVIEASDKGLYKPYWDNMREVLDVIHDKKNQRESEIVQLEVYKLITMSLEVYSVKFKDDGILQEELVKAYEEITKFIGELQPTTAKTSEIKDYIMGRLENVKAAITLAYEQS